MKVVKKYSFEIVRTKTYKTCLKYILVNFHSKIKDPASYTRKMQLMNPFYILLFCVLVFYVGIFIVASCLPKQLKKSFVEKFAISSKMEGFLKYHFVFCLILAIFFFDLHSTQLNFEEQKRNLQMTGGYMATELRRGYLSYSILKVQRNKYIVFTLFFTSIVTTAYIRLLNFYYKTEETLVNKEIQPTKITLEEKELKETTTEAAQEQKNQNASIQDTNKCKQD